MSWKDAITAYGKEHDREIHDSDMGMGIEFEDGCDAFWILPGEIFSTFACKGGVDPNPEEAIAAYEAIDAGRKSALHILRHHLAAQGWGSDRERSGQWEVASSGCSTEIIVGEALTHAIRDQDVFQAVEVLFKGTFGIKKPTEAQCKRYLKMEHAPENERSCEEVEVQDEDEELGDESSRQSVPQALAWMGLCALLDDEERAENADEEALLAAAKPKGPIAEALLHMGKRLPNTEAFCDLMTPGELSLDYSDEHDIMSIKVKSKTLGKRVSELGSEAAGDELAEEFLAMDLARKQFLGCIHHVASGRGWSHEIENSLNPETDTMLHVGNRMREIGVVIGKELTAKLREGSTAEALNDLIEDKAFAGECVKALESEAWKSAPRAPESKLKAPPRAYDDEPPKLLELTAERIREMDQFADKHLKNYYKDPQLLWKYTEDEFYAQGTDAWADQTYWLEMAVKQAADKWPHPIGILVMLDAGHPDAEKQVARLFSREQDPDCSEEIAEIAWRCRHLHPEAAREYLLVDWEQVPNAEMRAKYGDPLAIRKLRYNSCDLDDDEDCMYHLPYIPEKVQKRVHDYLRDWARTGEDWNSPDMDYMRAVQRMGWVDVIDLFEENDAFLRALLTVERRTQGFDEPGALMSDDFFLVWSRLSPSPFLARLVLTVANTDLVGLAREAAMRANDINPAVTPQDNALAFNTYDSWWKDLQPILAIAWRRCVAAGSCEPIS